MDPRRLGIMIPRGGLNRSSAVRPAQRQIRAISSREAPGKKTANTRLGRLPIALLGRPDRPLLTLVIQYVNSTVGAVTNTSWWVMIVDELMNFVIAVSALVCLALIICLCLVVRGARLATGKLPVTTDWLDDISIERYRPMLHLLDDEDLRFLRKQPGFTPQMAAGLRGQRCRTFRGISAPCRLISFASARR